MKAKVGKKYRMVRSFDATKFCGIPLWCAGRVFVVTNVDVLRWPLVAFVRPPKGIDSRVWYVKEKYFRPV